MNIIQRFKKTFIHLFFWIIGISLFYLTFRNQDFSNIWQHFQSADLTWAFIILLISVFNHFIRVFRWRLLIQPLGYNPSNFQLFVGLMFGYFVSLAIPRLGEVSRCIAVNRTEKTPFTPLLGTVITERIVDIFCLFLMLVLALVLERDMLADFYLSKIHPDLSLLYSNNIQSIRTFGIVSVLAGTLSLAFVISKWKKLRRIPWVRRIVLFSIKISKGITSIFKMKKSAWFIGYTLIIWLTYFLMTYLWFYSFEESSHLGLSAGLALMVIGSFGRSLPIQGGGMGAYHFLFTQGIIIYGVSATLGGTLSIMIHGLQILYYLLIGGLATLYLMFVKKVIQI